MSPKFTDNGTEFLSQKIMHHLSCDENQRKVLLTRSRAYKKNDNCHVEQKNWTHVREIFGYDRFYNEDLVPMMNEIYTQYYKDQSWRKVQKKIRLADDAISKTNAVSRPLNETERGLEKKV